MVAHHTLRTIVATLALVLFVTGASASARPQRVLRTSETTEGGYLLGNPQAPIKLVEYMSYTCPHCAVFSAESAKPLVSDYVASGRVAYEVRNAVRDPIDLTVALMLRCAGPTRYFKLAALVFAQQEKWQTKLYAADLKSLAGKPPIEQEIMVLSWSGLGDIMHQHGITDRQLGVCLSNKASQAKVLAMTHDAWDVRKILGTPAFFINDQLVSNAVTWESIDGALKAALGPGALKQGVQAPAAPQPPILPPVTKPAIVKPEVHL